MSETKLIRLTSGEEVLCTVVEKSVVGYKVEDTAVLIPTQNNSIGIMPWMPYAKTDGMTIPHDSIMFILDVDDKLKEQHDSIYSKIITPPTSILT